MQQIQDLQSRVEQLASENRMLAEAKIIAERHLEEFHLDRNRAEYDTEAALKEAELKVQERDEEIYRLKVEVEQMAADHEEQSRSMGVGAAAGLAGAAGLAAGAVAGSSWDEDKKELEELRAQHHELSTGVDQIVRREIDSAVAEKNLEIEKLQNDLTLAKQGKSLRQHRLQR
jgi:multidrug resistance efflux pump